MRYLVTGCAGSIGRHLVRRLLEQGHYVVGIDNFSRSSPGKEFVVDDGDKYQFWTSDIRKMPTGHPAFFVRDCCIHLAALNGTENFYQRPEDVIDVGVRGTMNVIEACRQNGIKDLIIFSSSEVYGDHPILPTPETAPLVIPDPLNPRWSYSAGKILSECLALNASGFNRVIIVRPFNVLVPGDKDHVIPDLIKKVQQALSDDEPGGPEDEPLQIQIEGTGEETRSYMYIDDFLDAFDLILKKGTNRDIYNVGNSLETSTRTLVEHIAAEFGRTVSIIPNPLKPGSAQRRCPDISRIQALGYTQKTQIHEAIKKMVEKALES